MAGLGALVASLVREFSTRQYFEFPMAATTVYSGGAAVIDTATGFVTKAQAGTTFRTIGRFAQTKTNAGAAGSTKVNVRLAKEVMLEWFANGTDADAIVAADITKPCYWLDDQTVSIVSTGHSLAGLIYDVDATKGVAVLLMPVNEQALAAPTIDSFANAGHTHQDAAGGGVLAAPGITAFTNAAHNHSNAAGGGVISAAGIAPGSVAHRKLRVNAGATATELGGDVKITGAAITQTADSITVTVTESGTTYNVLAPFSANPQTIVLATTNAVRGWYVTFLANGTLNTQTVTYKEGATALTAALDASKRHGATFEFNGTTWVCTGAHVEP
jgi:hypothetical protein